MHSDTVSPAVYEIAGKRWPKDAPGLSEAIAYAFEHRLRPRCLCRKNSDGQGIEMYVARLMDGYIVKRMPETGCDHAPDCPSYEPSAEFSGLGQVLGSAITENLNTGETILKLDFPLTKMPGRSQMPQTGSDSESVATDGTKLSLRGLLHYLWDQAELTKWHPGFAGKRTWGTVRRQLLSAAEHKFARGDSLRSRLYIPETFFVDDREAINARRSSQWLRALSAPGKPQRLMLLIGEVKEIVPARFGFKAVVKHVPDQAFALDHQLYRRIGRHFETELALWSACEHMHMVIIATFSVAETGVPVVSELSLMPVTQHWLPVENAFDEQLVDLLVDHGRSFIKGMRFMLQREHPSASAILVDTASPPTALWIATDNKAAWTSSIRSQRTRTDEEPSAWVWNVRKEPPPPFPRRTQANPTGTGASSRR